MSGFDLLPIGRQVTLRGLKLIVRAVWNNGAVFRTESGELKTIIGTDALAEIKAYDS
jgi:hypothetical protein